MPGSWGSAEFSGRPEVHSTLISPRSMKMWRLGLAWVEDRRPPILQFQITFVVVFVKKWCSSTVCCHIWRIICSIVAALFVSLWFPPAWSVNQDVLNTQAWISPLPGKPCQFNITLLAGEVLQSSSDYVLFPITSKEICALICTWHAKNI